MKSLWPVRSLSELLGKRVRLVLKDGRTLEGEAVSFDDFTEDAEGRELIGIQVGEHIDCAYDSDIAEAHELAG